MAWFARIRNIFRSNEHSDELDRELAFHLAERTDDLVARGMTPDDAATEARRRFGNYGNQKENTRDRDVFGWLDTLVGDVRYATRALRAAPGFALVAILSLALGIGANTAIFSLINAVMLKSLPVSHPEELVVVLRDSNETLTNPIWEYIRDHEDVFSGAFAYGSTGFNLSSGGEARRVNADWVSGDFFSTLGVHAVAGRTLTHDDDYRGCPAVATIGDAFWRSEYAGNPDAIGKTISLNGHPFQIVGVIDPAFFGMDVGQRVQVYVPLCTEPITHPGQNALDSRSNWFLQIVGRPKPGLTRAQLDARLEMLSPGLIEATLPQHWPADAIEFYKKAKLTVGAADKGFSALRTTFQKALYVLMAVVAIVLLIACANVANLLLARATTRQREIAVRLALGAGRGRLVRQLLTESLLLSLIGAALGVAFAAWGSRLLVTMMSTTRSSLMLDLTIDRSILAFTVLVATVTGILFGLAPAWRIGRVDPHSAMKSHGRGVAEGHSRFSMGKALVVAQIALSLVLVAGAGLLLGSWRRLANTNPGFATDQVLIVTADVQAAVASNEQAGVLYRQLLDRLRALPGVKGASRSEIIPIGTSSWNNAFKTDGFVPASRKDNLVWMNEVSEGYFATMGTPLLAGRDFGANDVPGSTKVAIINEAMAKRAFGTASPIGKQFRLEEGKDYGPPIQIIGVVGNAKYRSLRATDEAIAYLASGQNAKPSKGVYFEVRVDGAPSTAIASIRSVFAELSPRSSIEFTPMRRQVSESLRLPRTLATLSGFFGALALLLATIGLYGIMSYSIARRRNEIGVRIALGAAQSRVIRMVVGEVGRMVVAGIAIGTVLTLALTRLVATFLYGVKPNDPATMTASGIILALVAIGAAMLPAWRASRLDPVAALRED